MKLLIDLLKSALLAAWSVGALIAAYVSFALVAERTANGWLPWVAAVGVIVVFAAIYVVVPRGAEEPKD